MSPWAWCAMKLKAAPGAGGASSFLADRVEEDGEVRVFYRTQRQLPSASQPGDPGDHDWPGTMCAVPRLYAAARCGRAQGKNWLFFGNPHFTEDFLIGWSGRAM